MNVPPTALVGFRIPARKSFCRLAMNDPPTQLVGFCIRMPNLKYPIPQFTTAWGAFTRHASLFHFFIAEACGSERETRKSSSSRAMICAALASGVSRLVSTSTSGAKGAS